MSTSQEFPLPPSVSWFDRKVVAEGKLQLRYHPLTGEEVRINPDRARRPKQGQDSATEAALQEVIRKAKETNPFSRKWIFDKVPKFPKEICPEGRFLQGEAVLFPNLNPFAENHAVVVLCKEDFLEIEQFQPFMIKDALEVSLQYFRAFITDQQRKSSTMSSELCGYPTLMWNYLPPSAGSIIHPHFQVFLENRPLPSMKNVLSKCEDYASRNSSQNTSAGPAAGCEGKNFYADLITLEALQKERMIYNTSDLVVLASYAPRGLHEIGFYFPGVVSLLDLSPSAIEHFSEVLLSVLRACRATMGLRSFNLTSFSNASKLTHPTTSQPFMLHFRLFARPDPKGLYTSDTGPMERVYDSWVIDSLPELVATAVKDTLAQKK